MSSLVRRLEKAIMKRAGYTREKWFLKRKPTGEQEIVNVRRGGEITDPDDTPIGRNWPARIPARTKQPTKPSRRRSGKPRGQRRGKHNKRFIEARKAARAAQGGEQ